MPLHRGLVLGMSLMLASSLAWGQDERLEKRLDPEVSADVQRLVDSARAAGLPTEPSLTRLSKERPNERVASGLPPPCARCPPASVLPAVLSVLHPVRPSWWLGPRPSGVACASKP